MVHVLNVTFHVESVMLIVVCSVRLVTILTIISVYSVLNIVFNAHNHLDVSHV